MMSTLRISTQIELDAALAQDASTRLEIDSTAELSVEVRTGSPFFRLLGSTVLTLLAYGSSQPDIETRHNTRPRIVARGNSKPRIIIKDNSQPHVDIEHNSQPLIETHDKSHARIEAKDNSSPRIKVTGTSRPRIVGKDYCQPQIDADDNSEPHIVICDISQMIIKVRGNSRPHIETKDTSQPLIETYDNSRPHIETENYSQPLMRTCGDSQPIIEAYDNSHPHIITQNVSRSYIVAGDYSQPHVMAGDNSLPDIVVSDSSQMYIVAWDDSRPRVEAKGSSQLHVASRDNGQLHVVASGFVQLSLQGHHIQAQAGVDVQVRLADGAICEGGQQVTIRRGTPAEWCAFYDVKIIDGIATLYKAVDDNFRSAHGGDYTPGSIPVASDRDGGTSEHTSDHHYSSTPRHALVFNIDATKFVGCPVALTDIAPHSDADDPRKIMARCCCAPCWESDINGNRIDIPA
jgi:hypothetical protein